MPKKYSGKVMGNKIEGGISILIYADPGVGKTTLAGTLPPGETFIVNTEAGVGPLIGTGHVVFKMDSENVKDIQNLYAYLRTEDHPFKYVVLDNISELEQLFILSLTRGRTKDLPEIREYGDAAFKMRENLHLFRDLTERGITVIFNAWEMPLKIRENDGVLVTKLFPKLGVKIAPEVCGKVNIVGHLEVHEKSGRRWIRIAPNDVCICKSEFKGLEDGEEADLPKLIEKVYSYDYSKEDRNGKGRLV